MKANWKLLIWIGASLRDLKDCPDEVQDFFGFALDLAQAGSKHKDVKPLKGFGGVAF